MNHHELCDVVRGIWIIGQINIESYRQSKSDLNAYRKMELSWQTKTSTIDEESSLSNSFLALLGYHRAVVAMIYLFQKPPRPPKIHKKER